MAAQEMREVRRGSFGDGQAVIDAAAAPVGRFSLGQELLQERQATVMGSFADGQALTHRRPGPEGRFSTGQERGGSDSRPQPTTPAPTEPRKHRLELSGRH